MSPELTIDIKTIAITAVLAWGVTEIIKPLIKSGPKRKSLIRAVALTVGIITGRMIYPELGGQGGLVLGGALGGASGALNAVIVAVVKSKIKAQSEKGARDASDK